MLLDHYLNIDAIYSETPKKLVQSEEIIQTLEKEKEYYQDSYKKFGINCRYVASSNESFEDLSFKACSNVLQKQNVPTTDISLLVVVSQTSSSRLPNSGHIIQSLLGLKKTCVIFDINDGCNGYINALALMDRFLQPNEKGLLVSGDLMSKYTNHSDISNRLLMGDAISASLITKLNEVQGKLLLNNDGDGAQSIRLEEAEKGFCFKMDGFKVFSFTMGKIPRFVKKFINDIDDEIDNFDYIIPHQANMILLDNIRKKLKINENKMLFSLKNYGNTGPASIPLTISISNIKKGSKALLVGFGAGLSWGAISFNEFEVKSLNIDH